MPHQQNKIGDVCEFLFSDGRRAYAQYIHDDRVYGPLIQVFDLVTREDAALPVILASPPKFPPIFCDLARGIRDGILKPIDRAAIQRFDYPGFVVYKEDDRGRKPAAWYLWDGRDFYRLGLELPQKFHRLEYLYVWTAQEITERIETGKLPSAIPTGIGKNPG